MKRQTRFDRLIAVFDRLDSLLAAESSDRAAEWAVYWRGIRPTYICPPAGVRKGQLSAGLMQGLLEMPLLIGGMPAADRRVFSNATALAAEYPELLQSQQERLGRIVARGRISNESEFHLVRQAIDMLEGEPTRSSELDQLYGLVDAFEARRQ